MSDYTAQKICTLRILFTDVYIEQFIQFYKWQKNWCQGIYWHWFAVKIINVNRRTYQIAY